MSSTVGLLELKQLVFDYPEGVRAVDGFDASFHAGEIVCICGPNGSGKSTVLKLAAGLLEPNAGEVVVDGTPLSALDMAERAKLLASVPQRLEALPETTVESFVLGGRYAHSSFLTRALGAVAPEDREFVEQALAETDAAPLAQRRLAELSGGQRQRVLVARALAQRSAILLFDEPTAMLDPAHQVQIFQLIASVGRGGRTALVATHDLNLAGRFADRILLLEKGRIQALGPPSEILKPDVLCPIYGSDLLFQRQDGRILVVPWPFDPAG